MPDDPLVGAQLGRADWPARARVRGTGPIGVGTGWVESASGLLVRTAALNRLAVRPFLERVLAVAAGDPGRSGAGPEEIASMARDLVKRPAASVNGGGATARAWTRILSTATLQPGLESTTTIAWADRFSARGALRDLRALCPACHWDWARGGGPLGPVGVWEPLRWQFRALEACVIHEVRLVEECPTPWCRRKRAVVAGWASTDRCVGCRFPFARPLAEVRASQPPLTADELDWAHYVDAELSDILERSPDREVAAAPFAEILAVALESVTGGRQREFAARIGMTEATVSYWKDGRRTPTLDALLRVCRAAGFRLRDVLLGDLDAVRESAVPPTSPYVAPSTETHRALDAVGMERVLRDALTADPPPTLASIYADARVDKRHVRRRFAFLCAAIRERRRAWERERQAAVRADRSRQIREAVADHTSRGIYPSRNQLRKVLPGVWLRRPEFESVWREAVVAAGWGDPSELRRAKGARTPSPVRVG